MKSIRPPVWLVIVFLVFGLSFLVLGSALAVEEHATGGHEATYQAEAGHASHPQGESEVAGGGGDHAAAAHGEAAHGEGEHHGVTPSQIRNLIWWTVNFVLLVFILVKFGKAPVSQMFRERRESIEGRLEELEAKRREAEARYREYEHRLSGLEEEARQIMEAFVEQGEKEKARIIAEAKETAERIKQQAEFYVQQELEKARQQLREEVADLAVKMAEDIIKKNITPEDQKRLVGEFIEKVVQVH